MKYNFINFFTQNIPNLFILLDSTKNLDEVNLPTNYCLQRNYCLHHNHKAAGVAYFILLNKV